MSFQQWLAEKRKQEEEKRPGFWDIPNLTSGIKTGVSSTISGLGTFLKNPIKNTVSGFNSFSDWVSNTESGKRASARKAEAQGGGLWANYSARAQNTADYGFSLGKTILQDTAGGIQYGINSLQSPDAERLPWQRTKEAQDAFEQKLYGRDVGSFQESFQTGSEFSKKNQGGTFENFVLGSGLAVGMTALEVPIGGPAKTQVKTMVKEWVKSGAKRAEIEAGIRSLNMNPDKAGELVDSLEQIIVESNFKQGEKVSRSNRLIDFVLEQEKKTPVSQPKNSVLQVRDMKTGKDVFYKVSPEDLRILSEDLIDGTKKGVAGKQIGDKIYHLTAKTPKEMLDTAGWSYGGQKELSDVMEMIKPPARRVTLRTEDGRFAGSFMDEGASYKLAAQEISAERTLAEQVKRFADANSFVDEVSSIADRMAKYANDPKVLRSQVSRVEEKLFKSIEKYADLPRVKQMLKEGKTGGEILQQFYGDVTGPNYRNQSIFERSFDKTFEEVTSTLENIFGRRIPIAELSPKTKRGGAQVMGKTDGTVISLLRRAGGLNQAIANHEGWHWFKRNLSSAKAAELDALEKEYFKKISPAELADLKNTYKQGSRSDESYTKILREEYMADEFARYYETGRTTWQKVADFFDKALLGLKTIFKYQEDITKTVSREFKNVRGTLEKEGAVATVGQGSAMKKLSAKEFQNFTDLSTKILGRLEGKTTVSKQFIQDLTNSPDIKQAERDLIRAVLDEQGDVVDVARFADEVKAQLLPLQSFGEFDSGVEAFKKIGTEPSSRRIKIDAEIREIRKAINAKEYNAEQVGDLSTRIDIIEEALPDVQDIRRVAGFKRVGDDTLSQIQASAMRARETNDLAKNMTLTESVKILGNQKAHNAQTLEAARLTRRAHLDDFITEYGFDTLDEAQLAIEQFDRAKADIKILRESLQQSRGERALANKASAVASAVSAERRSYVTFLQDQFQLSDAEIKKISFGRDLQRMGESEFKGFINKMEQRAVEVANTKQAKWELMALLEDMHFEKVDNYRRVQGFPPISQMNETQLRKYAEMLGQFTPGDEFLTQRTLETINRGELAGVNTMREVRERLWTELQKDPQFENLKLSDLENMESTAIDSMRYDTALAEANPFYHLLVNRTQTEMLRAKGVSFKIREEVNRLTRAANASRNKGIINKVKRAIIPKQTQVIDYLEATPAMKDAAREKLTKEELDLANYMEKYYSDALDHLVSIQELRGSRYEDAYFTHTRKKFLEKWSDDGLVNAIRDVFQSQKDQAAVAQIIDQDTGNILSKSKFFKYTLRRSGDVDPSQNATEVFLNYVDQMERKKALDKILPEITVYTEALTPKGTTKKGLQLDRSLKTFVNKYLNNKKARRENFGGAVAQGGKVDVALRMGNSFVSLLDLGGNIFSSAATVIGESVMTLQALGATGMARGIKRRLWDSGVLGISNPKVKNILSEAEPFIGRNFWSEIADPNIGLGDRALIGIYAPFSQSSAEMNKLFLLSKLTKEEIALGKLSAERLAELRLDAGRWRDMGSEVKSIFGSTSVGGTVNKYKGWAIPIARTNIDNIKKLVTQLRARSAKDTLTSREFQETLRAVEITMAVYLIGSHAMQEENTDSFSGKLYARAQMEALTIMGGIDPRVFISVPRVITFLEQLTDNLVSLVTLEKYKGSGDDYEYGDLKGAKRLQRQFTPAAFRQFNLDDEAAKKTEFKNKVFNKILLMEPEEAKKAVDALTAEEWETYKEVRSSWRAANTRETRSMLQAGDYKEAVEYVQSLPSSEAKRIVNLLTDEEWDQYQEGKGIIKSPYQQQVTTQ